METIAPVAQRIKAFIDNLDISDSQFADATGISRPTLSLLLSGKNKKVSDVMISQIHYTYPDLSIPWLLFGEGPMTLSHEKAEDVTDNNFSDHSSENIDENGIYPDDGSDNFKNCKEIGVKDLTKSIEEIVRQELFTFFQNPDFFEKMSIIPKKARKVVQVTVYYDDSTFEIFKPH